jgi:VWFA-related protein
LQSISPQGDTAFYDATWEALETLNASKSTIEGKQPRQALILLTDGLDNRSKHRADEVAERAKEDNVRLFTLGLGSGREVDTKMLAALADATGGRFFHIESPDKLTDAFEELSIELHDDGIDEASLQRLAAATGGQYYHVRESDKLQKAFEQLAAAVENTHSVKFTSRRARHDGTARGIEIRLGSLASVQSGYATHGLLTPQSSTSVYLIGLIVLGGLIWLALAGRR